MIPISTLHDIVSTSDQDGWWRPLETNKRDQVLLSVNVPVSVFYLLFCFANGD